MDTPYTSHQRRQIRKRRLNGSSFDAQRLQLLENPIKCFWCREPVKFLPKGQKKHNNENGTPDPLMATKEHLVPVSAGGKVLGFSNVVIACFRCNQQRGGLLSATDKFAKYLEAIKLSDLLEQVLELKEETWH